MILVKDAGLIDNLLLGSSYLEGREIIQFYVLFLMLSPIFFSEVMACRRDMRRLMQRLLQVKSKIITRAEDLKEVSLERSCFQLRAVNNPKLLLLLSVIGPETCTFLSNNHILSYSQLRHNHSSFPALHAVCLFYTISLHPPSVAVKYKPVNRQLSNF